MIKFLLISLVLVPVAIFIIFLYLRSKLRSFLGFTKRANPQNEDQANNQLENDEIIFRSNEVTVLKGEAKDKKQL